MTLTLLEVGTVLVYGIFVELNIFNSSAVVFLISLGVAAGISLEASDPAPGGSDTLWRPELLRAP